MFNNCLHYIDWNTKSGGYIRKKLPFVLNEMTTTTASSIPPPTSPDRAGNIIGNTPENGIISSSPNSIDRASIKKPTEASSVITSSKTPSSPKSAIDFDSTEDGGQQPRASIQVDTTTVVDAIPRPTLLDEELAMVTTTTNTTESTSINGQDKDTSPSTKTAIQENNDSLDTARPETSECTQLVVKSSTGNHATTATCTPQNNNT